MPILTPKGMPSAKYSRGRTWKRHMRIEKIARLTISASFTNEQIAASMNVCPQTIVAIRQTPEFHAKMIELKTGVVSDLDLDMRLIEENQIDELAAMVPTALLVLRNSLLSSNPNIALKAAETVMDRDGALAKVSKVSVTHENKPDLSAINTTASSIMALLGRQVGNENENANVASGFTVSASDASGQVKMMEDVIDELVLADIDLSKNKPN